MPVLEKGYSQSLFSSARQYLRHGYSVLPVYGDLDLQRAKISPVKWTGFQHRHPTEADLYHWFIECGYGGLAIVCGRISQLVVLDFDDAALAQEFAQRFPDLAETQIIQSGSRGLPHYHYHTTSIVPTKRCSGVDFQSDGSYIVAPPTMIVGGAWRAITNVQPRMLTEDDLTRVSSFLRGLDCKTDKNASTRPLYTFSGPSAELLARYSQLAAAQRNEGLFRTAIWARDHGWSADDVKRHLVEAHVSKLPSAGHCIESPKQRRREALRTIESAFRRPPQKPSGEFGGYIPNSVREALLRRGETATLRVLEALTLAGWKPGRTFTEREARDIAMKYSVGEWSVRKALKQGTLFETAKFANAARKTENTKHKKCFFVTRSKPQINLRRGRPNHHYVMPTHDELCQKLGVKRTFGDQLTSDDLQSCRAYRQAVLRELIKRRPGLYSRAWLADLLGVSVVTTRRYSREIPLSIEPTYQSFPLGWSNLESLIPPDLHDARPGAFLEDESGKKYPAVRVIACRLLQESRRVWYRCRGVNYYAYAKCGQIAPQTGACPDSSPAVGAGLRARPPGTHSYPIDDCADSLPTVGTRLAASSDSEPLTFAYVPAKQRREEASKPDYTQSLDPRLERVAREVYETIYQITGKYVMSLERARALVIQYGAFTVENTLAVLNQRRSLRNPAGFLVRLLESRYGFMTDQPLTPAEIFAAEQAYQITRQINPKRALSWENACRLAREHGQIAIESALKTMQQRRNITNPAGFLVKLLKSQAALPTDAVDDVHFAEHVYHTIRAMNPQRALSQEKARLLVATCGRKAVEDALRLMSKRNNIQNPAGFMVTLLRANKLVSNNRPRDEMTPEERHRAWIEQLKNSPYRDFYANAEDFMD